VWGQAVLILIGIAGFAAASDVPSPTARRTAQREAWTRFHNAHPELAIAVERGVISALTTRVSLREVMQACAATDRSTTLRDLPVSSAIELTGRDVSAHAWRCDTPSNDRAASTVCGCVVARLPGELHVILPGQVPEATLAPYDGQLALRLPMAQ
jgi:hypothetical protein